MSARHFSMTPDFPTLPFDPTLPVDTIRPEPYSEYILTDPNHRFTVAMEGRKIDFTAREVFGILEALKGLRKKEARNEQGHGAGSEE